MDNETFQPLEGLLVEAENRARVVLDGYTIGQAGYNNAYFIHTDICRALAHLRALNAMNV